MPDNAPEDDSDVYNAQNVTITIDGESIPIYNIDLPGFDRETEQNLADDETPARSIAEQGEYWCPSCREKKADDYQEVAETCGERGRQIWLCPNCAQDLVRVTDPISACPYCGGDVLKSVPVSESRTEIECSEHGELSLQIFPR